MMEGNSRLSTRRVIRVIWLLQDHVAEGVRLKPIADALDTSMPSALRDLRALEEEGVAERVPGREECWRLTPKLVNVARAVDRAFTRRRDDLRVSEQRYGFGAEAE